MGMTPHIIKHEAIGVMMDFVPLALEELPLAAKCCHARDSTYLPIHREYWMETHCDGRAPATPYRQKPESLGR
jgi:hypothetical protein